MAIQKGAKFYATNDDRNNSIGDTGFKYIGGGTMVNALAWPEEQYPKVIGKPNTTGLELILKQCGKPKEECLMIGDRLETDIAVGNNFSNFSKMQVN